MHQELWVDDVLTYLHQHSALTERHRTALRDDCSFTNWGLSGKNHITGLRDRSLGPRVVGGGIGCIGARPIDLPGLDGGRSKDPVLAAFGVGRGLVLTIHESPKYVPEFSTSVADSVQYVNRDGPLLLFEERDEAAFGGDGAVDAGVRIGEVLHDCRLLRGRREPHFNVAHAGDVQVPLPDSGRPKQQRTSRRRACCEEGTRRTLAPRSPR